MRRCSARPTRSSRGLKKLEAGGVENVLLVDPTGSIATLQIFAKEVMPAFANKKPAPAKVV